MEVFLLLIPTENFEKEVDYCAAIYVAKSLLKAGLINDKEYNKINNMFIKSFSPDFKFAGDESAVCQSSNP